MSKNNKTQNTKTRNNKTITVTEEETVEELPRISPVSYFWKIISYSPWLYSGVLFFRSLIFAGIPQVLGLTIREYFNALTGTSQVGLNAYSLVGIMVGLAILSSASIFVDITLEVTYMARSRMLVRKNIFDRILQHPGARAVPGSPGEAVSRFRGDVDELTRFTDQLVFVIGQFMFTIVAFFVMLGINRRITVYVFIPMTILALVANRLMDGIRKYHRASRRAAGKVTGFIGEIFGSAQAVKVATAEIPVLAKFRELNEVRKTAELKTQLFRELIHSVFWHSINLITGFVMILVGREMQLGSFSVG